MIGKNSYLQNLGILRKAVLSALIEDVVEERRQPLVKVKVFFEKTFYRFLFYFLNFL